MIRLGLTNEIISLPITMNLATSLLKPQFQIKEQSLQRNYIDLIRKELDAAFITPSDYAKDSSLLKLVKDIAIYNKGESRYSILFFQKDLTEINEIACRSISQYDELASILLNEFFEIEPAWKVVKGKMPLEILLKLYPAVLQNGAEALENYSKVENKIDIIDEWWDKTELSFVHQVLAIHRDVSDMQWVDHIYQSREAGIKNLKQISERYGKSHNHPADYYLDLLKNFYHYSPEETVWEECAEYLQYLFYYGKIRFFPEFHFV